MAVLAALVLSLPPLIDSQQVELKFQPLIKTMEGTRKVQAEKIATISHALNGNALFFLGASEVATSEDEHFAVYNFFNTQLHQPTVAYGDSYVDDMTQLALLTRFKQDLSPKTKLVLLLAPDSFYFNGIPPTIFADHFPDAIFKPLMSDKTLRPILSNYLKHIDAQDVDHLTFSQMRIFGWHYDIVWREINYQFSSFCELIRDYFLTLFHIRHPCSQPWPLINKTWLNIDWDAQLQQAEKLNHARHESPATLWMDKDVFADDKTAEEWYPAPPSLQEEQAFEDMIKLLHERQVNVVVIIDPLNPWALKHTEKFKNTDRYIQSVLQKYNTPYFDMYSQKYQNGWNWDRIHPTELAWVAMDRYIAEAFKK
ncbi:D-alanyl-lipoteichoic acid biosynthesis protein DltD [Buttiauxella agrestis]|uniref:D-alanyl-lipoteichoic acid biosynthesis protein DltD n=2 Tax=Buttiauxella agrestis TaxID=82977 RepID=A0A381C7U7_9ENTR|nr:D-alanyl-lipoteichoic acid biosynthesis protein DltD [Buttiauxella agrestis]